MKRGLVLGRFQPFHYGQEEKNQKVQKQSQSSKIRL